jgi:hypothetical protein
MNASTDTSPAQNDDQREALERSERAATERQPENFKDSSTKEKKVEIGPDMTDDPIKGIDPDERPGNKR